MNKTYYIVFGALAGLGVLIVGCKIDSADSIHRNVNFNVQGIYRNPNGGSLIPQMSGHHITQLDVIQSGATLEAIDSNGILFKGSLGDPNDGKASFSLKGETTAGAEATISGAITKKGTTATMTGTWIEPTLVSTVFATANVAPDSEGGTPGNGCEPQGNHAGCCSGHVGISTDENGCVIFDSQNRVMCMDGQPSPTCRR